MEINDLKNVMLPCRERSDLTVLYRLPNAWPDCLQSKSQRLFEPTSNFDLDF